MSTKTKRDRITVTSVWPTSGLHDDYERTLNGAVRRQTADEFVRAETFYRIGSYNYEVVGNLDYFVTHASSKTNNGWTAVTKVAFGKAIHEGDTLKHLFIASRTSKGDVIDVFRQLRGITASGLVKNVDLLIESIKSLSNHGHEWFAIWESGVKTQAETKSKIIPAGKAPKLVLLSSKAAAALKTNLLDQESELQTTYKYLVNGFSFALLQYEFPNDTHAAALAIFGKDFREFLVRAQGRPFDALS